MCFPSYNDAKPASTNPDIIIVIVANVDCTLGGWQISSTVVRTEEYNTGLSALQIIIIQPKHNGNISQGWLEGWVDGRAMIDNIMSVFNSPVYQGLNLRQHNKL